MMEKRDMISALPDDLLVTILLLVPTKDAAGTMILSKRWRLVWLMLPRLEYEENNGESVWWFLKKTLELHRAPVLAHLCVKLGPQCPIDANVGKLVEKAVASRVRVLEFELRWTAKPTRLPNSLYTCETLLALTLSHEILLDFPSSYFCLPSLKHLCLWNVEYEDEASLVHLLSSCPVLESLGVIRKKDDNVTKFSVKTPILRRFYYENSTLNDDADNNSRSLIIDAPALTYFGIADYSGDAFSVERMPLLEEAYIEVEYQPYPNFRKFLRLFSSISYLELCLTDDMIMCCSNIEFPRLVDCRIVPYEADWMDSLVGLLEKIPILKYLTVDYGSTYNPPDASLIWTQMGHWSDPECMCSSLEKFWVLNYRGRGEEQELVEYILTTSKCLKTATISLAPHLEPDVKEAMIAELEAITRLSITSRITFETYTLTM